MIVTIEGVLAEISPIRGVIEIGGLGYEVHMPLTTTEKLSRIGQTVKLHTVAVYKEDSQSLYGFYDEQSRDFFKLLVEKVSGIGPKIALNIMSRLSIEMLRSAIANNEIGLLSKCPGIGKKTAERLVIELRDKVLPKGLSQPEATQASLSGSHAAPSSREDALAALLALGYKPADADKAIRKAIQDLGEDAHTQALIKKALN